jgi:hypothetical protein
MVALCSRAPEIAGERLPDDKELIASNKALDDVNNDLSKLTAAISRVKIAGARFQKGARAARDRCETKVRIAYRSKVSVTDEAKSRSEAGDMDAKSEPDEAPEPSAHNPIYDGPVAIRPMVTAPRLMGRVPPTITKGQMPAPRP